MTTARRQALNTALLLARSQNALQYAAYSSPARSPSGSSYALNRTSRVAGAELTVPGQSQSCWTSRAFSSANNVQNLLNSMQAVKLRDSLDVLSDTKPFLTYKEFTNFIIQQGAADTEEEAHRRADTLVDAGVVLRFDGIVYLRPQEVSELVYRTLPTNPEHAKRNLAQIENELAQMDGQHQQIRKTAKRWPRFWLWTGCAILTFQLVAFTYLTWWELSWDVMEPVGYILSLTYSCMAYLYFLLTRGNSLDYGPFEEYWTQQQLTKKMYEKGFDFEKYQHLVRTRERYKRYLASQAEALPVGGDVLRGNKAT